MDGEAKHIFSSTRGIDGNDLYDLDFDLSTPEIDDVPLGKTLIITDIVYGPDRHGVGDLSGCKVVYQVDSGPINSLFYQLQNGKSDSTAFPDHPTVINFRSGLPVSGGATIKISNYGAYHQRCQTLLCGYLISD